MRSVFYSTYFCLWHTAKHLCPALKEIARLPKAVYSDIKRAFVSRVYRAICRAFRVGVYRNTTYLNTEAITNRYMEIFNKRTN